VLRRESLRYDEAARRIGRPRIYRQRTAAAGGPGRSLGLEHLLRWIRCGDVIAVSARCQGGEKACGCGALAFDIGRSGSAFGDAAVEVYRLKAAP